MNLSLIMMDNNKIHNLFKFKSNLGIKYQDFIMILQNVPTIFIAIHDTQSHITQLTLDMSYMTIWNNCYNNNHNNIKIYHNHLQQLLIPANVRQLLPTKTNNDDIIYNNCHNRIQLLQYLQKHRQTPPTKLEMPTTTISNAKYDQ